MIGVKLFAVNLVCSAFSFLCDIGNNYPEIKNDGRSTKQGLSQNPILTTKSGPVQGYLMSSSEGNIVYAFEGIPYAQSPVNELRFQAPVPVKPWENVWKAMKPPPVCLQVNPSQLFRTVGQEDCLYLNIYSSEIPLFNSSNGDRDQNGPKPREGSKKLPVVIWIHGGAFSFGYSGDYGPAYLLNQAMVLVTFNYRVGVLGFLSTGDSVCPGNNGLKDQALAIKWVYDNIEYFGGDVEKITLMGQSAGGVSVHLHMLSEQSRKYFQAAVSLSGTAFAHWAILSKPQAARLTEKMAMIQGCPIGNSSLLMQCMNHQNPVFLVANQLSLQDWTPFPAILFAPVIEAISNSSFLSESPDTIYAENRVAEIPWITSTTSQEGYILLLFNLCTIYYDYVEVVCSHIICGENIHFLERPETGMSTPQTGLILFPLEEPVLLRMKTFRANWSQLAPLALNYKYFVTNSTSEVTDKITKFYLQDRSPRDATLDDFSEIISDRYFTFGFEKGLRKHSKVSRTYGYIWKYKGKYNIANNIGIPTSKWGVGHGEDVFYIFNSSSSYPGFALSDPEYALSKIIVNVMYNFFQKREPLYSTENGADEIIWTPVSSPDDKQNEMNIIQFDHDIKMIPDAYKNKLHFWLSLNLSDTAI